MASMSLLFLCGIFYGYWSYVDAQFRRRLVVDVPERHASYPEQVVGGIQRTA